MQAGFRTAEGVIIDGAEAVAEGRQRIMKDANALEDRLQDLIAKWQGRGAVSFQGTMARWREAENKLRQALEQFEQNLRGTDDTYVTTDQGASDVMAKFESRMP